MERSDALRDLPAIKYDHRALECSLLVALVLAWPMSRLSRRDDRGASWALVCGFYAAVAIVLLQPLEARAWPPPIAAGVLLLGALAPLWTYRLASRARAPR